MLHGHIDDARTLGFGTRTMALMAEVKRLGDGIAGDSAHE
jgi:hypothetical protein